MSFEGVIKNAHFNFFRICALLSSWVQCCLDRDFLSDRNDRELYDRLIDFLEILGNPSEECRCQVNRVKLSLLRVCRMFLLL